MFPQGPNGEFAEELPEDAAIAQLEDLRADGAAYLIVPRARFGWLAERHRLAWQLQHRFRLMAEDEACRIFDLRNSRITPLAEALLTPEEPIMAVGGERVPPPLGARRVWPVQAMADIAKSQAAGVRVVVVPADAAWSVENADVLQAIEHRCRKIATRPGVCEMFELDDA
jgi:RNase P protein component